MESMWKVCGNHCFCVHEDRMRCTQGHLQLLCQSLEAIPLGLIQLSNLFFLHDAYREVDTNGQRSWMPRIWNQAWVTS